jgi:organic radical activating enzyme
MKKIIKVVQAPTAPSLHLTWIINNICTNSCSYCPASLHNGANHNYDWDNARRFFQQLFKKYPTIHCTIAGGEPSVSPFLPEIVKTFYEAGHTIGLTSNAAKPVRYWDEIAKMLNYICFSYHPEFPDPQFVEKISAAGWHTPVCVRVMMLPSRWDHCIEMIEKLSKIEHVRVEPVRILDWTGENRSAHLYSNEQLEWFNHNNGNTEKFLSHFEVQPKTVDIWSDFYLDDGEVEHAPNSLKYINDGMTNFYGYSCEVGLKSLFVDHHGDILLSNCGINGSIGNINNPEGIMWPTDPVICNKRICHCTTDVNINKIFND